ncbi:DUF3331 domain-containing protein [Pararobbsia alpina]|uniref:DUF3331 domain-containing protein n=1 Tax=Pararobbsia alpina TaxID=621374 RepID=A0A6S7CGH6_9BURK|nr:DUF3331 domain-containing protein [Pararobbsia alpina]CAB3789404.1 hypothetical protein LMG28138_02761 [Pararobbsia alpina]
MGTRAVARAADLTVLPDRKSRREEPRKASRSLPALERVANLVLRTAQEGIAQVRTTPIRAISRQQSAANATADGKVRLDSDGNPSTAVITVVERQSSSTVLVSWRDSTFCHYVEQTWRLGVARCEGICALSGSPIRLGDSIYRPRSGGAEQPINANAMILDAAIRASLD